MPSFKQTFLAIPLLFLSAYAQSSSSGPNAFNVPMGGYTSVTAGKTQDLTWNPTTGGTVTLVLRSGSAANLNQGTLIANNIPNNGKYTWSVQSDITRGSDYTVEIIADGNPQQVNFTPQFAIDSTNTVASSTGIVTVSAALAASSAAASDISKTSAMATSGAAASSSSSAAAASRTSAASSGASSAASTMATSTHVSASVTVASTTAAAAQSTKTNAAVGVKGGAMGALAVAAGLAAFM